MEPNGTMGETGQRVDEAESLVLGARAIRRNWNRVPVLVERLDPCSELSSLPAARCRLPAARRLLSDARCLIPDV